MSFEVKMESSFAISMESLLNEKKNGIPALSATLSHLRNGFEDLFLKRYVTTESTVKSSIFICLDSLFSLLSGVGVFVLHEHVKQKM
jgi:hypothetical protein